MQTLFSAYHLIRYSMLYRISNWIRYQQCSCLQNDLKNVDVKLYHTINSVFTGTNKWPKIA